MPRYKAEGDRVVARGRGSVVDQDRRGFTNIQDHETQAGEIHPDVGLEQRSVGDSDSSCVCSRPSGTVAFSYALGVSFNG